MQEMSRISDATGCLWRLSGKIRCIGELCLAKGFEPFLSDKGTEGLSYLLEDCSTELDGVIEFLERGKVQPELIRESLGDMGGLKVADAKGPDHPRV